MASRSHHVVIYSHATDTVVGFLTDVVGMEVSQQFHVPGETLAATLGWPDSDGATAWMLGKPPAGLVEVIGVPEPLQDRIRPGIAMLSFAVRDLENTIAKAHNGLAPTSDVTSFTSGDVELRAATCTVDGIPIEFIQFPQR